MNQAILDALYYLKSDHVQQNKYRLGALGSSDIDMAIRILEAELKGEDAK